MGKVGFINVNNLKIARENVGMTTFFVSRKFNKSDKDVVLSWENGELLPTWCQVDVLARAYNVPELIFFSNKTINKNKVIPDYRIIKNIEDSEKVKKLVNFVIRRQEWLERILKKDGVKNKLQGSGKDVKTPGKLAELIKNKLDINLDDIKKIKGAEARKKVLKYLIEKAENFGIFVGKTLSYHYIEVEEMRGLFISNDYCPFIVLNRKDAVAAQIFSFIHELAHLFRKTEAISNSLEFRKVGNNLNDEEVFCNKVAVELLLPREEFTEAYYDKNDIDRLSKIYKLSTIAIFYRLRDLNKIRAAESAAIETEIKKESENNLKNSKKQDGGNYLNNMKDSNGGLFNKTVSKYYSEEKIGYTEASNVLRFSVEDVW
jgi:Zn-dependent peptidase ImmA (M78 family)